MKANVVDGESSYSASRKRVSRRCWRRVTLAVEGIFLIFWSCLLLSGHECGPVTLGGMSEEMKMYDAQEAARSANQRLVVPEIWLDLVDQATESAPKSQSIRYNVQAVSRERWSSEGVRKTSAIAKVRCQRVYGKWLCLG